MTRMVDELLALPRRERERLVSGDRYLMRAMAGPHQLFPTMYRQDYMDVDWDGDWSILLFHASRGAGKTISMSWLVDQAVHEWGVKRMMYVGATSGDVIDTNVNGDDGIIQCSRTPCTFGSRQHGKPQIRWDNGAICRIGYPSTPTTIRGGSNEVVFCDEFAFWEGIGTRTTDDPLTMIQPTLRKGKSRLIIATTPNVDNPLANRELLRIKGLPRTVTRTVTIDEMTHMPEWRREEMIEELGGRDEVTGRFRTYMGRQELGGEIIIDPGSVVWTPEVIEDARARGGSAPDVSEFQEVIVSIDPSRKSKDSSDPTGLVVLGRLEREREYLDVVAERRGADAAEQLMVRLRKGDGDVGMRVRDVQMWVLEGRDGRWAPEDLAEELKVERAKWGDARRFYGVVEDNVTGEHFGPAMRNFGLDMYWEYVSADRKSGDKRLRALDALAQYQLGVVRHCPGLYRLETQMELFTGVPKTQGSTHDDMVDALSQAVNWLSSSPAEVMSGAEFAERYRERAKVARAYAEVEREMAQHPRDASAVKVGS